MKYIKKILPELIAFPILTAIFLVTRLVKILSVPIFTDEAIYTRWAQIARFDSNWRFISLTDGKQPSFIWLDMIVMKIIDDPLLSGRLVSVGAGFVTVIGLYFLSLEIFKQLNKKARIIGLVASTVVVLFPFSMVYDRLAIYESLVAAFFVWALYFQIRLVRNLRFDHSLVLGFVLGGAVLTKSIGFLSIYLMPFLMLLMEGSRKSLRSRALKFIIYAGVSTCIAYGMYSILRLSPFFHIIEEKNSIFVYPVSEWMKFGFVDKIHNFSGNFSGLFNWFYIYFTLPFILLAIYAFFVERKFLKEKIILLLWFVIPFLGLCVFGKTLYPRYVFFMVMPLIPLVSFSIVSLLSKFRKLWIRAVIIIGVFAVPIYMDYSILFNFSKAPIPRIDLEQYINGWPAGGGIAESSKFFEAQAENGPVFVATQGTFGLLPLSYEIYFLGKKNITIKGYWPIDSEKLPEEIVKKAIEMPTYFVFYQPCPNCEYPGKAPEALGLIEVISYKKGIGSTQLTIYQVKPIN